MVEVVGVRFRKTGKIYLFRPGKYDLNVGDNVIVGAGSMVSKDCESNCVYAGIGRCRSV